MWIKFRGHLFNFSHICGVSADGPVRQSGGRADKWYVRIYSSGKCFEVFSFESREERDICFDELEQVIKKLNQGVQLTFEEFING